MCYSSFLHLEHNQISIINGQSTKGTSLQGCADGGMEGGHVKPPRIFKLARKLVKSQQCCKRVGHSIFCELFFLLTVVGQFFKAPPPPLNGKCFGISLFERSSFHRFTQSV